MSRLQEKRTAAGLSQSQLAKAAGLNLGVYQHYEQGNRNIDGAKIETLAAIAAKIETLAAIAAVLGCKIVDILESEELAEKVRAVF